MCTTVHHEGEKRMTKQRRKSLFVTKGSHFSATYQLLHPRGSYFQTDLMEGRNKQGHLYPVYFSAQG